MGPHSLTGGAKASKVRIIGGGLTGLLAAFQAHDLGVRDIELHDRFDQLGGHALPRQDHGLEIRECDLAFGSAADPARRLLESHGVPFEDVESRTGSVTASGDDLQFTKDFGGPALRTRDLGLGQILGHSLADRIRAYPHDIAQPLAKFCQWRLGAWLDEVHADTARALGMHRVFPLGPEVVDVAGFKRADPRHDAFYGVPAPLWGRLQSLSAGVPKDGLAPFFLRIRQALGRIGVRVVTPSFLAPHAALNGRAPDEVVVWAADPRPLFKPVGLEAPKPEAHSLVTYILKVRYGGPVPLDVRNFTAQGAVTRLRLYETRGQVLLAAECLSEVRGCDLTREIHKLMAGFNGASLQLGETLAVRMEPRWDILSVDTARSLVRLRAALARSQGGAFIAPLWEVQDPAARHEALTLALRDSLQAAPARAAAA
ncbi:FAD/NAD(P)-binding protein [Phenylobacterium aquaticum]|uniref:NAD(P)-binding protein n=1 Tax=Phenylobacterium aquaticum TaxID=1763816 RepID=UPI0026EFFCC8|nr:FAD/NAD(P)-binding protein [Phenylobacterium aquaticum]